MIPIIILPLWSFQGLGGGDYNGFACLTDCIHLHVKTNRHILHHPWLNFEADLIPLIIHWYYFLIFEGQKSLFVKPLVPCFELLMMSGRMDLSLLCLWPTCYAFLRFTSCATPSDLLTVWLKNLICFEKFAWKKGKNKKDVPLCLSWYNGRSAGSWNRPCRVISGAALGYKSLCGGGSNVALDWM